MENLFTTIRMNKMLDNESQELFGEFGFDTLTHYQKVDLLQLEIKKRFDESNVLLDNDRLLQSIQVDKERKVLENKLFELCK